MPSLSHLRFDQQLQLELKMNRCTLFAGDIIAVGTNAPSSEAIQWSTAGDYSHAMLYEGDGLVIDAMPNGGVAHRHLKTQLEGAPFGAVFRHRTATREQCLHAVNWAKTQVKKKYDFISAANAGLSSSSRTYALRFIPSGHAISEVSQWQHEHDLQDATFMCSELVLRAFEIAGAPIIDAPAYSSSPAMLRRTSRIVYMGDLRSDAA